MFDMEMGFFDCPKMKNIKIQKTQKNEYKMSNMDVYCSQLSKDIVNT